MDMIFVDHPESLKYDSIHLSSTKPEQLIGVIDSFFRRNNLNDIRKILKEWLFISLSAESDDMNSSVYRNELLLFAYRLEVMIEAIYKLFEEHLPLDQSDYKVIVKKKQKKRD